ncbi:hypothetical protein JVU11DRAFT_3993 [Chiua virens]|nr:hypothetical protein JVU11DRAFT_3993 [Chiua virens]
MISRYVPFAGMGLTAYAALRSNWMPCPPSLAENIIHAIGIIASEILLVVRTYAHWKKDKRILYGLLVYGALITAAALSINIMGSHEFITGAEETVGCYMMSSRNSVLVYALILAFEMAILILTIYKQHHDYRHVHDRRSLVHTLYFDGVVYILCIGLISVANVIVDAAFPIQYSDLLDIPQITFHSVLASRIMFHLRKSMQHVQIDGMSWAPTTMVVSEWNVYESLELEYHEGTSLERSDERST